MPSYNDLLNKLEAAAKAIITAASISGLTANTGQSESLKAFPIAVSYASKAIEEVVADTGLWRCELTITVDSVQTKTTLENHSALVAQVNDLFLVDDIASKLSDAQSDFFCQDVKFIGMQNAVEHEPDRIWKNELTMECVCCASDIT